MASKKNLVIVESPAKAKTIGKYLGPDYVVKASMGHLRDLPKSKLGVDVDNDFEPDYRPIKGKEDIIKDLKTTAGKSKTVFLATDPDREGEAISWHLQHLLELPEDKAQRVTFNEITKKVVQDSIQHPRAIDQDLVDAQQARRVLDRIVGYQLSPLLWKKIRRGLSAGRVQSVAIRLVAQREKEIAEFVPQEYWSLDVHLQNKAAAPFTAHYYGVNGKKYEPKDEADTQRIVAELQAQTFSVKTVKRTDKQRSPTPPFTTSSLQQEASRKLNMTPARTMSIAQQLYEGIDISGEGAVGLITYMRTDSLRLSEEALAAAKDFIHHRYGPEYYPPATRHFKTKGSAQDAHEAIRPSDVTLTPEDIKKDLTGEQYRLYKLIWSRFLACQMANAVYDSLSIEVENSGYTFRASHSSLKFSGFTAVYEEGKDEEEEERSSPLPDLKEGEALDSQGLTQSQHFTQPPARYSEASLIRALEEKGIGRPSTYAPTISTILNRYYVVKEGKALRPTPLGEVVTGLMKDKFQDIVDPTFTAQMEEKLDEVEEGKTDWKKVLSDFYQDFEKELTRAEKELDGERIKVPDEVSEEICPQCGRNLVVKMGRFGQFLACPGWPECDFTMPMVIEMPGKCPKCGGRLLKRTGKSRTTGKQYTFYCCERCSSRDEANKCDFRTWDVPVKDNCPVCGQTMFKKAGRGAKKPFCINESCSNFTPEDKRGGWQRKPAAAKTEDAAAESAEAPKTAKKPAAKKTAATKKTTTVKKTAAAKKTTAAKKSTAAKKATTAKKTTTTKKAAATKKTTAAKKTVEE